MSVFCRAPQIKLMRQECSSTKHTRGVGVDAGATATISQLLCCKVCIRVLQLWQLFDNLLPKQVSSPGVMIT